MIFVMSFNRIQSRNNQTMNFNSNRGSLTRNTILNNTRPIFNLDYPIPVENNYS